MTAGPVFVMPSAIVLVADTRCPDSVTGAVVVGAEKLFIHGGKAAIFSYGCGPCNVQQKVDALDPSEVRPPVPR
jgi:hypothetical protein